VTASGTLDAPVPVVSTSPIMLGAAVARGAELEIRVSAPTTGRDLPILIFAHGFAQSSDGYLPLRTSSNTSTTSRRPSRHSEVASIASAS